MFCIGALDVKLLGAAGVVSRVPLPIVLVAAAAPIEQINNIYGARCVCVCLLRIKSSIIYRDVLLSAISSFRPTTAIDYLILSYWQYY
ncbi:unnamed protein product [Toxocara canis]|uniref:Secreted protein n=1 Tax=Toxocara canis TaxID=6265 RepID=A0A183V3Y5_TOXCA|nr:unnamed protein product [Toxocara canis]